MPPRVLVVLGIILIQACDPPEELGRAIALSGQDSFRGVEIEDENSCSVYNSSDYSYPQSVEDDIIDAQDGLFSPYTLQCYSSQRQTDIEHIVARSEAHDSGLCAASDSTKRAFARDLLNLTLAPPNLNRYEKGLWMWPNGNPNTTSVGLLKGRLPSSQVQPNYRSSGSERH